MPCRAALTRPILWQMKAGCDHRLTTGTPPTPVRCRRRLQSMPRFRLLLRIVRKHDSYRIRKSGGRRKGRREIARELFFPTYTGGGSSTVPLIVTRLLTKPTACRVASKSSVVKHPLRPRVSKPVASAPRRSSDDRHQATPGARGSRLHDPRIRSPGHRADGNLPDKKRRASKGPPAWIG